MDFFVLDSEEYTDENLHKVEANNLKYRENQSYSYCSRQSDDEEDDLALLRLAALKSLNNKKTSCNPVVSHTSPPPSRNATLPPITTYAIQQIPSSANIYCKNNTIRPIENVASNPHGYYPPATHNLPISEPVNNHIDLELLRLAALKSLHNKKEPYNPVVSHNSQITYAIQQIPSLEEVGLNEPYVPQRVSPTGAEGEFPLVGSVNNWHQESSKPGSMYNILPYVTQKPNDNIELSNIQLSPRSLAFIAENNDVLMRRNEENLLQRSPSYSPPSPQNNLITSSSYRLNTPESWTNSSLPEHNSPGRTNNHHHVPYGSRRSRSPRPLGPRSPVFSRHPMTHRSPTPQHISRHISPPIHHRYSSRSPPPKSSLFRQPKSRSPPVMQKAPPQHGSRSPQHLNRHARPMSFTQPELNDGKRRRPVVAVGHVNKTRRFTSPPSRRPSSDHESKQLNKRRPVEYSKRKSPPAQMLNQLTRTSFSPSRRSHSRSPPRKYARRSRERLVSNNNMETRRRYPQNTTRRRHFNGFHDRIAKRSRSPIQNSRKRSRTKSPDNVNMDKNRNRDNGRGINSTGRYSRKLVDTNRNDRYPLNNRTSPINTSKKVVIKKENTSESISQNQFKEKDIQALIELRDEVKLLLKEEEKLNKQTELEKNTFVDKTEEHAENDTSSNTAMEDVEEDSLDNISDDDDDDESESENEGRFKCSTSQNERDTQASTLSFSKLGSSISPVVVNDLKDVETNKIKAENKSERDNKGRRKYDRRKVFGGTDDQFRKTDNRRFEKDNSDLRNTVNLKRQKNKKEMKDKTRYFSYSYKAYKYDDSNSFVHKKKKVRSYFKT